MNPLPQDFLQDWQPVEFALRDGTLRVATAEVMARFVAKISVSSAGCWLWTAATDESGYPVTKVRQRTVKAHRLAFMIFNGPIPDDMHVDHECHTRAIADNTCKGGKTCEHRRCVNPAHLRLLSPRDNVLSSLSFAAVHAARTACVNGHPLVGDALHMRKEGGRACRECRREGDRRRVREAAAALGREVLPLPQDRTHCVNGHPFDEENTKRDRRGWRSCRACALAKGRAYKARKREQSADQD